MQPERYHELVGRRNNILLKLTDEEVAVGWHFCEGTLCMSEFAPGIKQADKYGFMTCKCQWPYNFVVKR